MVNHSPIFAERAISLIQNLRPDYRLVLTITHKVLTFADIVAYTVSVSNLDHVISIFTSLCGTDVGPLLQSAVDRWATEVEKQPVKPIIDDYEQTCRNMSKLFELRHMICHEAPKPRDLDMMQIENSLRSLADFIRALEEVLTSQVFGKMPLTQTDMNEEANRSFQIAEREMQEVLAQLTERYKSEPRRLKLLKVTQSAWERYRRLQAVFRHDPVGGGTIGPMLRSAESEEITVERKERLLKFLMAAEGDL